MKDANSCYEEGMKHVDLSWHADTRSEMMEDLENAIAAFDRALALQPDHADAWFQKGHALARLERYEAAAGTLMQAVRLRPEDAASWLHVAKALVRLGKHEAALLAYDETLHCRPDDPDAWYGKAEVLDALNRDAEALAAWNRVLEEPDCRTLELHGRSVRITTSDIRWLRAQLSRANALARLEKHDEAQAAYRKVIGEHWQSLHGPLAPLEFHEALRHFEDARLVYREHIPTKTDRPAVWLRVGDAFVYAGQWRDALAAFETMIGLAPDDPDGWHSKAEALVKMGRREEALGCYRRALAIRPGYLPSEARLKVLLGKGE